MQEAVSILSGSMEDKEAALWRAADIPRSWPLVRALCESMDLPFYTNNKNCLPLYFVFLVEFFFW